MNDKVKLTGKQINNIQYLIDNPPRGPDLARESPDEAIFDFHVGFDGTGNDMKKVPAGSRESLVARNFRVSQASNRKNLESFYYPGVATDSTGLTWIYEYASGRGCKKNSTKAHADLVARAAAIRVQWPSAKFRVHIEGFSRGAATALDLSNIIAKHGLLSSRQKQTLHPVSVQAGMVPITMVLFDPVSYGQGGELQLSASLACKSIAVFKANGEERSTLLPYRQISASGSNELSLAKNATMIGATPDAQGDVWYQRIITVAIDGARHSDLGGTEPDGGMREVVAYLSDCYKESLGFDVTPVRPTFEEVHKLFGHDSRTIKTDEGDRQAVVRAMEPPQKDTWDGRCVITSCIKGVYKDDLTQSASIGQDLTPQAAKEFKKLIDRTLGAVIRPATRMDLFIGNDETSACGLTIDAKQFTDKYSVQNDLLHFLGTPVPGVPPISEIRDYFDSYQETKVHVNPVVVTLNIKRMGVEYTPHKSPFTQSIAPLKQQQDPWPKELIACITHTNFANIHTASAASRLMNEAIASVANTVYAEFDNIENVVIKPIKITTTTESGRTLQNSFEVTCERGGKSINSTPGSATTLEDVRLAGRMQLMVRGLQQLSSNLFMLGFDPAADLRQRFNDSCKPPGNLASMTLRSKHQNTLQADSNAAERIVNGLFGRHANYSQPQVKDSYIDQSSTLPDFRDGKPKRLMLPSRGEGYTKEQTIEIKKLKPTNPGGFLALMQDPAQVRHLPSGQRIMRLKSPAR